jgi:bifunctional DNA-binding transcriptional regulator/antitoxin component of YhaV-PrlF toxin-antitoxin module
MEPVAVLSVGQNGQITIPAGFRKDSALSKGGKILAVRMGQALVLAPHDGVLESICLRLEEAMKGAGLTVESLKGETQAVRAQLVRARYGAARARSRRNRQR